MNDQRLQGPAPTGAFAPASFWEFYFSVYPIDKFIAVPRLIGVRINVGANTTTTGVITVNVPVFAYAFRTDAWTQAGGVSPTIRYAAGLKDATGIDYTNGTWGQKSFGDSNATFQDVSWPLPLELGSSTQLTVTVDNTLNAASAAITIDAVIHCIQPVQRNKALLRATGA